MPLAILALTMLATAYAALADGYAPFVLALVALTTVVGVGLNILVGLTGQMSLGHVGFYAIGAYTAAILTIKGVDFWIAFPLAGVVAGAIGFALALPALRVTGPYLAMVTIAFAFIVQHGATEWRDLTGGANGLMNLKAARAWSASVFAEREMAVLAVLLAGRSLLFFYRLANSAWGRGMVAVRDAEVAAQSIGLNPVIVKTAAFALSAVIHRAGRRDLRAVVHVRRAGFVSVLAVDPVSARRDRRRCRLGVGSRGGRGHQRDRPGDACRPG